MQIKSLKLFCDIVRLHSFSRAAEENGVSQSSASQMVHHLEEHLGVPLIDRSTRPFTLTPEGVKYHDGCRRLVRRYEDLEHEVRNLHDEVSSRLAIASIYSVGLAHMSQFQREFQSKHPNADVRLDYLHPDRVYAAVESEQADLGIISYPTRSKQLGVIPWREEKLVLVVAPGHRLAKLGQVEIADLDGEPMIAFQHGLKIREMIDRKLSQHRVETPIAHEFDNIETLKLDLETGEGFSFLPEPTVSREALSGRLVKVPVSDFDLSRPLGILHRRDEPLSETARHFIDLLHDHASDLETPVTNQPAHPQPPATIAGALTA